MMKQITKFVLAFLFAFFLWHCEKLDTTSPELTLLGDDTMRVVLNETFDDPGATAKDNEDGDLSQNILITSKLNTDETGIYQIYYTVTDNDGNKSEKVRYVIVYNQAKKYSGGYNAEVTNLQTGDLISYVDQLYPSSERNHYLHTKNFMDDSADVLIFMNPDSSYIEHQPIDSLFIKTPDYGYADSMGIELNFNLLHSDSTIHSQYELNYQRSTQL